MPFKIQFTINTNGTAQVMIFETEPFVKCKNYINFFFKFGLFR